jgi:hypothetical protein
MVMSASAQAYSAAFEMSTQAIEICFAPLPIRLVIGVNLNAQLGKSKGFESQRLLTQEVGGNHVSNLRFSTMTLYF